MLQKLSLNLFVKREKRNWHFPTSIQSILPSLKLTWYLFTFQNIRLSWIKDSSAMLINTENLFPEISMVRLWWTPSPCNSLFRQFVHLSFVGDQNWSTDNFNSDCLLVQKNFEDNSYQKLFKSKSIKTFYMTEKMRIFACGTGKKIMYTLFVWAIRVTMLRFQYNESHILKQAHFQFLETITFLVFSIYFLPVILTLLTNGITTVKCTSLELKTTYIFKILHV